MKAVAGIVAERLDARDQPVVLDPRRAVLELAHAVVDVGDEIGDAVGDRGVGGIAAGRRLADEDALAARIGGELGLGDRDQLGEDLGLLLDAGAAAEEDVDDLLEVEQPEGQLEVLRADDVGHVAEAAGIFVVRIDEEDAQIGLLLKDLIEDQGDAGRLADAGRAENGEVLAEHLLEIDVGGNRLVELKAADRRWCRRRRCGG